MRLEPGRTLTARGLLFDMDGTLVDSGPVVERVWSAWAIEQGLDVAGLLPVAHGRRAIETITMFAKTVRDPEAEARKLEDAERLDIDGLKAIEGALALIASLPADRWALVTSADEALARTRLAACGFPVPEVLVTAESVERGKPAPDPYLLGARGLGFDAADCIVFEDADAGLAAGHAAKAQVIAVASLQSPEALDRKKELWVPDLSHLRVQLVDGLLHLTVEG
jgi:mannitol-1-/sugar-/sorbitol-6-phosphatase